MIPKPTNTQLAPNSPDEVLPQEVLFMEVQGSYYPSDRIALRRATKSGMIERQPGARPKDVCYKRGEFQTWHFANRQAKHHPLGCGESIDRVADELPASQQSPSLGILGLEPATLVDVEVVDEQAELAAPALIGSASGGGTDRSPADEEEEFRKNHDIVVKGLRNFILIGLALMTISQSKLYRAGGYKTFADYLRSCCSLTAAYASRLMFAARVTDAITKTLPIGNISPYCEAQIRPLSRLTEPTEQVEAWRAAVARAGDRQPTAKLVEQVVSEIRGAVQSRGSAQSEAEPQSDIAALYNKILESLQAERPHKEIVSDVIKLGGLMDLG